MKTVPLDRMQTTPRGTLTHLGPCSLWGIGKKRERKGNLKGSSFDPLGKAEGKLNGIFGFNGANFVIPFLSAFSVTSN